MEDPYYYLTLVEMMLQVFQQPSEGSFRYNMPSYIYVVVSLKDHHGYLIDNFITPKE